jgi:phosphoribosylformylglycinamidine synthase
LARWEPAALREMPQHIQLNRGDDFTQTLKLLLASPNICGKRWVWQQYDHMVQTNTVEAPGAGDAGVIRIKNPNPGEPQRGLAMALDGNSRWCYLDPRLGAMHAVAEAARKVACSGATPVGATNCLNFGNPEKPHIMWQFSQTIDGITKACEELEIPITGGNVSFYNETLGEGIYPTPVLGVVGILDDVNKTAKAHFAGAGRAILLLRAGEAGDLTDVESEFGSSEYAKEILGQWWGYPPELDLEKEAALQKAVFGTRLLGRRIGRGAGGKVFCEGCGSAGESGVGGASRGVRSVWRRCQSNFALLRPGERGANPTCIGETWDCCCGAGRDNTGAAGNFARRTNYGFGGSSRAETSLRRRPASGSEDGCSIGGRRLRVEVCLRGGVASLR